MPAKNDLPEPAVAHQSAWKAATVSVRGSSHLRSGLPNQDACDSVEHGEAGHSSLIVAVADGHGGARHFRSQTGSQLAVQAAVSVLSRIDGCGAPLDSNVHTQIAREVESEWRASVHRHCEQNPFSKEEVLKLLQLPDGRTAGEADDAIAYGSTLLAVLATDAYLFFLQIGDGDVLAVRSSGETLRPVPSDSRLIGNETTSLCQPDSWRDFRSALLTRSDGLPGLVLLSTDGYANSFRTENDFLKIGRDYLALIRERSLRQVVDELPQILEEASRNGSGDDISLGLLYNAEAAGSAVSPDSQDAAVNLRPREHKTRAIVPAAVLLAALGGAAFWVHRHGAPTVKIVHPKPQTGDTAPHGASPKPPPKPDSVKPPAAKAKAPHPAAAYILVFEKRQIQLTPGRKLSSKDLWNGSADDVYAEVGERNGALLLINRSADTWTVIKGATKNAPVGHGDSVTLKPGLLLRMHQHSLKVEAAKPDHRT